jgi:hypothetical protein
MRDFIIYRQLGSTQALSRTKFTIDELGNANFSPDIQRELANIENATLTLTHEDKLYRRFEFLGQYSGSRAGLRVSGELKFELWQQVNRGLAASFDIKGGRAISKVAVTLLAYASLNDPFAITPMWLGKSDFLRLKAHLLKEGANVTQLIVQQPNITDAEIRQLQLRGARLEKVPDFDHMLNTSSRVRCLGFVIPAGGGSRSISFRIIEWGGGQIYVPTDLYDHEIVSFLDLLENVLIRGGGPT